MNLCGKDSYCNAKKAITKILNNSVGLTAFGFAYRMVHAGHGNASANQAYSGKVRKQCDIKISI